MPENLNLADLLRMNGDNQFVTPMFLDRFYYLIDHIYLVLLLGNYEDAAFVTVNHRYLENIVTPQFAGVVKRKLLELGVIEEDPKLYGKVNYRPGIQSKGFRLTNEYRNSGFKHIPICNLRLLQRIQEWRLYKNNKAIDGHEGKKLIKNSIEAIDFDSDAARKYLEIQFPEKGRQRDARRATIESFENRHFNYSPREAGRFYHIFTSCPSDLRQFASFKGQPLYLVDVSDCQPALHAILYPTSSIEKQKYIDKVSKGAFKTFINSKLSKPLDLAEDKKKKELKEALFHHVFYGSPYADGKAEVTIVFNKEFPELAAIIKSKKPFNNKSDLPVYMQSLEAGVVIDNVARRLANAHKNDSEFCLISIHDCLVTTRSYIEEVQQEMIDGFNELLGFELSVKVESLAKGKPFLSENIRNGFELEDIRGEVDLKNDCMIAPSKCEEIVLAA